MTGGTFTSLRRMVAIGSVAAVFAAAGLATVSPAHAFTRVFTESSSQGQVNKVSGVFEMVVLLDSGLNALWTEQLVAASSCGADPVMHVWEYPGQGTPSLSASNDDCGTGGWFTNSPNACVVINNPGAPRVALVVVHAYANCTASTGIVRHLSASANATVGGTFGGHILTAAGDDIGWNVDDVVQVVRPVTNLPPSQSYRVHALRAPLGSCGYNDVHLADGVSTYPSGAYMSRPPGGRSMRMEWNSGDYCRVQLVVGHSGGHVMAHQARAYINDVFHADSDGDGLGDELEGELGTCASQAVAPGCGGLASPANARDTDGDGLEDGWEVLGTGAQRLPAWGAHPLHKDAFVELDWNNSFTGNPMDHLFAIATWLPFQGGTAASLGNPDNVAGLRLHLDIGVSGCNQHGLYCGEIFGNWGGSGPVAQSFYLDFVCQGTTTPCTSHAACTPNDCVAVAPSSFTATRRGLFFYGLIEAGAQGGGQASPGLGVFGVSATGVTAPIEMARVTSHEIGHLMGLNHWGDRDDPELNCKPSYRSVMSYAYAEPDPWQLTFSTGGHPSVNSASLNEQWNPGVDLQWLEDVFGFEVDHLTTEVDWNRDGDISAVPVKGVTRRSVVMDSCGTSELHQNEVFSGLNTDRIPALVSHQGTLHAFFVGADDKLRHTTFTHSLAPCTGGQQPPSCCPVNDTGVNVCDAWTTPVIVPTADDLTSAPSAVVVETSPPKIALVYRMGSAATRRFVIRTVNGVGAYEDERSMLLQLLDPVTTHQADATLVYRPSPVSSSSRLQLYYLGPGNRVRQANLRESYETLAPVITDRSTYTGVYVTSKFAVGATRFVSSSGADTVRLVTTDVATSQLQLYSAAGAQTITHHPTAFDDVASTTLGRPSIVQETEISGGLEVMFPADAAPGNPTVPTSVRRTWAPTPEHILVTSRKFITDRNILAGKAIGRAGIGLAVYQGRLQAAAACGACEGNNPLQHFPFASGVFPIAEHDNDDFASIRKHLCGLLRRNSAQGCQPCLGVGQQCLLGPIEEIQCAF